jgi:hypothetical protein
MIKLDGKYDVGGLEHIKCEIQIKKGLLTLIKKDTKLGNVTSPIGKKDYKIIRTNSEYGLPVTHKYAIKFIDYYGKYCYVYTDMMLITKWWVEVRKSNRKSNIAKAIIWILLLIATFILQDVYNILKPTTWYKNKPVKTEDTTRPISDSITLKNNQDNKNKTDSIKSNINLKNDTAIKLYKL